jgi:putative ABC transport system substrate-binding protein
MKPIQTRLMLFSVVLALCAMSNFGALAQGQGPRQVGILWMANEDTVRPLQEAVAAGLRDHGYEVGRDIVLHARHARGDTSRLPALAEELIALKPDVVLAIQITAVAVKEKSTTTPIVLLTSANPVAAGLAQSLERPGGSVTGLTVSFDDLAEKQIELLTELSPKMARLALLVDPGVAPQARASYEQAVRKLAQVKGFAPTLVTLPGASELDKAFAEIKDQRADALLVAPSGLTNQLSGEIAAKAQQLKLPVIAGAGTQQAERGMLMSYGPNIEDSYRYATKYVDRILKGAKPEDLPIERYSRYELVINMKTAKTMGVEIPQSLRPRANRMIE